MNTGAAIAWFKKTFGSRIAAGVQGTPFSIDLVVAIATQETSYIWSPLVEKGLNEKDVLRLCVGDTLDVDKGRNAFPRTKDELLSARRGAEMFAIAREALLDMATVTPGYGFALNNGNKFCHGFGIFQYDIQFFRTNPDFFLCKRWEDFSACLAQLLVELREALSRQGWEGKRSLSNEEQVLVGIAYNKGTANPSLGFKQGHKSDDGRYYGENINDYLQIAQAVEAGDAAKVASVADTRPVTFQKIGIAFQVHVPRSVLHLRSEPSIPANDGNANVIARLPDDLLVQRLSAKKAGKFMQIEAILDGVYFSGWAAASCLVRVKRAKAVAATTMRKITRGNTRKIVPARKKKPDTKKKKTAKA